jgi:hypothetical protein
MDNNSEIDTQEMRAYVDIGDNREVDTQEMRAFVDINDVCTGDTEEIRAFVDLEDDREAVIGLIHVRIICKPDGSILTHVDVDEDLPQGIYSVFYELREKERSGLKR